MISYKEFGCNLNIYVSFKIAEAIEDKEGYIRKRGLNEEAYKRLIIPTLKMVPTKKAEYINTNNSIEIV